ncbi:aldehyde dehydrogenase (NADP(+)) [Nocardia carnea]|uniref:aldehyde dehydrogenase (NADP(+)) n=1 Tax=Nocardia carnea TaxID=37328 RepID=UPI0024585415|nr:aldehyde dehydrogenase (NADP(+)) [Nocardia carnea]
MTARENTETTATVWSLDARTGTRREQVTIEADADAVNTAVRAAHATLPSLADRERRAEFLRAAADELDTRQQELTAVGDAETALGIPRMTSEIARASGQLRMFAEIVTAGDFLDVIIDHADPGSVPPRPDLRRYRVPIGVVAVYAASNFPFAFSVAGGDTASALAAGCPVVVKAHPDHPATSEATARALQDAAQRSGLPPDVVRVVHGFDAGVALVRHPLVAAAGFTGSVRGGRALFDAAAARPVPIPFHGELGSLNPVVVTSAAAAQRAEEIGTGLAGSMTLGNGQFCVKPGLIFLPSGADGDHVLTTLVETIAGTEPGFMLDDRIRENFIRGVAARGALPGVETVVTAIHEHRRAGAAVLTAPVTALAEHDVLLEECFGPVTVVARYDSIEDLDPAMGLLPGSLSATVHIGDTDSTDHTTHALLTRLSASAGRLVVNQWPTGVAVAAAQHHGGPYPASTSTSTSVGATAVERWLRPVAYQNTPDPLLPPELREQNPLQVPRIVDRFAT